MTIKLIEEIVEKYDNQRELEGEKTLEELMFEELGFIVKAI